MIQISNSYSTRHKQPPALIRDDTKKEDKRTSWNSSRRLSSRAHRKLSRLHPKTLDAEQTHRAQNEINHDYASLRAVPLRWWRTTAKDVEKTKNKIRGVGRDFRFLVPPALEREEFEIPRRAQRANTGNLIKRMETIMMRALPETSLALSNLLRFFLVAGLLLRRTSPWQGNWLEAFCEFDKKPARRLFPWYLGAIERSSGSRDGAECFLAVWSWLIRMS